MNEFRMQVMQCWQVFIWASKQHEELAFSLKHNSNNLAFFVELILPSVFTQIV